MGGVIDTIFGGGQGQGFKDLQNQLQQGMNERRNYQGQAEQALSPYIGGGAGNGLSSLQQYQSELAKQQNAPQFLSQMLSGYKESPYAHQLQQQGQQALGSAAAQSGMLGSGAYGQHAAQTAEDISNQDMQQYLNNAMGVHNQYMQGLGNLNQQQYGASTNIFGGRQGLGQDVSNMYGQLGQAKMGQDISRAGGINTAIGSLASLLSGGAGGGIGGIISSLLGLG